MCTCITYENSSFYFGRNLDLDCSFGERVVVTPRNFSLTFRHAGMQNRHYAMIGMAAQADQFPLYADAVNEKGLAMAGLNFPGNAFYQEACGTGLELASFEMIAWILGKCASVSEAETFLSNLRVVNTAFSHRMPPAPLHWMLADREKCIVLEAVREGMKIYDNPIGVLTNNPPFEYHRLNLNNYINLTAKTPENRFSEKIDLRPYAQGMGAAGLPGDASSASRFVRAAFLKLNSVAPKEEASDVAQFFHIMDGVSMVRGTVITESGTCDITTYSSCMNTQTGVYYFKTYEDCRIRKASMEEADLEGEKVLEIPISEGR